MAEKQRVVLVGINITAKAKKSSDIDIFDSMKELEELAQAAGAEVIATAVQNKDTYDPAYLIGKGKVEEIGEIAKNSDCDLIIFNDVLSGVQLKNLEQITDVSVIDRTALILDIFAQRALSKEGKLQVELAMQKYRLSHLTGLGGALSRLGAGIGTRGPGEKKLETDKRHINRRIIEIKKDLEEIAKNRSVQRLRRSKSDLPIVALVGYTNSGKSTILNEMIRLNKDHDKEKEVLTKDMLFATLDVSHRKCTLPSNLDILVTDTVGFVSKLPHELVESFKATLEEVKYADLLLHVVDLSNEKYKLQMQTTEKVLSEIGISDKKTLYVFNKADKVGYESSISVDEPFVMISAAKKYNLDKFYEEIERILLSGRQNVTLKIPYKDSHILSLIKSKYPVQEQFEENFVIINTKMDKSDIEKYSKYIGG